MPHAQALTTKDWILSRASDPLVTKTAYREFAPDEELRYHAAKGLEPHVHKNFRDRSHAFEPAFVALIEGGRVWGANGIVLTPDNRLLSDVSWEYMRSFLKFKRHSVYRRWTPLPLKKLAGTVGHVSHISSRNYYHWLFDILPRIGLIRAAGFEPDTYVFRGGRRFSYQNETLDMLGIPKERRMFTNGRFHVQAGKLVVPSLTSRFRWSVYPHPVAYSRWACQFVRDALLPEGVGSAGGERLYISRANARHRRLLNEREIIGMLVRRGFSVIDPASLSVKEQIGLFAAAKVIAAPHGAGFANLAFCSPGTKVLELFSPAYTPGYYWMLSNVFGLDYYYLIGHRAVKVSRKNWPGGTDFYVKAERLEQLLEKAEID